MVLERIVPEAWLERKFFYAFFLGAFYGLLGIALARLLFASDPAIPAIAFTSLFLLPELYTIFKIEEAQQEQQRSPGLRAAWRDNGDFFRVYLCLFLGILVVSMLAAMILPSLTVNALFHDQLAMRSDSFTASGNAIGSGLAAGAGLFKALLTNNAIVLGAVFFVALLAGDGAIFLITWNASLWGAVFGVTARNAAYVTQGEPFLYFMQIVATVTPHVLLEASAYILAAMAGGLLSRAAVKSGWGSAMFKRVLAENGIIIVLALVTLVLGAFVESVVLQTSTNYERIVQLALR
jgi:uncharacterized membrane protein SpoIIM required for sporulation